MRLGNHLYLSHGLSWTFNWVTHILFCSSLIPRKAIAASRAEIIEIILTPSSHILLVLLLCNHMQRGFFCDITHYVFTFSFGNLDSRLQWWGFGEEHEKLVLKTSVRDQPHHGALFIFKKEVFFHFSRGIHHVVVSFFFLSLLNAS